MFFLVSVEMLNYTGLATVQGGRIGPVCLFGSVVCIGVQSGCGQVHVGFLQRKNCLLLVVSVKLAVKKEASVKDIFCWTDSQVALWWIQQKCKEWKFRSRIG